MTTNQLLTEEEKTFARQNRTFVRLLIGLDEVQAEAMLIAAAALADGKSEVEAALAAADYLERHDHKKAAENVRRKYEGEP